MINYNKIPIILALGSNLGDREKNLADAVDRISAFSEIIKKSYIYESEALLTDNSPEEWNKRFYNSAISIKTNLSPIELLNAIKKIENDMKRDSNAAIWSPRIIDIDIILYNDKIVNNKNLTIPHKNFANRLFVLYPLNDLISDKIIPIYNKNILTLLDDRKKIENLKIWRI